MVVARNSIPVNLDSVDDFSGLRTQRKWKEKVGRLKFSPWLDTMGKDSETAILNSKGGESHA